MTGREVRLALGVGLAIGASVACGQGAQGRPAGGGPGIGAVPQTEVAALRPVASAPAAPVTTGRNPFTFGGAGSRGRPAAGAEAPLPPPDGLPVLPLPLPQPALRLLGVITLGDSSRVAAVTVGSDLVLARPGELLAGRFRVGPIGDQAVDLTDTVGDRPIRLALP